MAADAMYQGASGGKPRHTDKPYLREESIHGMVDYISGFKGVDENRLGIFGRLRRRRLYLKNGAIG